MKSFELIPSRAFPQYDVKITLKPSYRCNQKCWYCPEYDNKSQLWTDDSCEAVIDKLSNLPDRFKNVFIYMYGGEPTLSPHWEYIQMRLSEMYIERNVFFQTQTNMSIKPERLDKFLLNFNQLKPDTHIMDICSSYHLGKQHVDQYIDKMKICESHGSLGLCHFSTEIPRELQTLEEFNKLESAFPGMCKLKFTVIPNLTIRRLPGYTHLFDDEYLVGDDKGEYMEYRYFMRKYPHLERYLEHGWTFNVDGEEMNYTDVVNRKIYKQFKYKKCTAGSKGVVIDHNLLVYHCNDDFEMGINSTELSEVDLETYLNRDSICLNCSCWDGLDFKKYEA